MAAYSFVQCCVGLLLSAVDGVCTSLEGMTWHPILIGNGLNNSGKDSIQPQPRPRYLHNKSRTEPLSLAFNKYFFFGCYQQFLLQEAH